LPARSGRHCSLSGSSTASQRPDPRNLSQPRLSRRRHLWRRCRGPSLFRQIGAADHPLRECRHRRSLKAPTRFNPDPRSRQGGGAHGPGSLCHGRDRIISEGQAAGAIKDRTALAAVAVTRPGARYFADWIAEQLADFAGLGRVTSPLGRHSMSGSSPKPRRRSPRPRPRWAQGGGQSGGARGDVARRCGPRHGRRPRL